MKIIEGGQMDSHKRAERVVEFCSQLARYSEHRGETTRLFLSHSIKGVHQQLCSWMEQLGMTIHLDAIGNLHGVYEAYTPDARRLLIGSHIDTVPNAGAFDGVLGVLIGIGLIEALHGRRLPYAIEIIAFSEEEGVRFGVPSLGSRALTGTLNNELLEKKDAEGISVEQAIRNFGLDPAQLPGAVLGPEAFAFLEFHIEQGPILDQIGVSLGVVEIIAGQTRMNCIFRGQANHAGTTPMFLRRDALTAAAELITTIEKIARNTVGLVATVGELEVSPGASNVIPGEVHFSLDIRHAKDGIRHATAKAVVEEATRLSIERNVVFDYRLGLDQRAVPMHPELIKQLGHAVTAGGYPLVPVTSGAGHDAMVMAGKIPSAMLFLRSPGGISHHPEETVHVLDVQAALNVGLLFLEALDPLQW